MRIGSKVVVGFGILVCLLQIGCGHGAYQGNDLASTSKKAMSQEFASMEVDREPHNTEEYDSIIENDFLDALSNPQSTFSIDVDTASYSNVRRLIQDGHRPPKGAVRIEEFINYFSYDYPQPEGQHPFSVSLNVAKCPWQPEHQLVRIALKGKEYPVAERPASNLVFLIDVSGSMSQANKLPLVKEAFRLLLDRLDERDSVTIAVYAGASGLALPTTHAGQKQTILKALEGLAAGGSTNGGEGIRLAYKVAKENFIEGGINRVILCTDGDFNVGVTNRSDLIDLVQTKAKEDIFLSVLGFGTGNYKDATMENLADKGNGNYAYIDSLLEARKTLVSQMNSTLMTIAKDVKIQVDFNPTLVQSYRLIGYENRMLKNEDFDDDSKDAGEIGAGHTVTAFYEIIPAGVKSPAISPRSSEFVESRIRKDADPDTMLRIALRYKLPDESHSQEFGKSLKRIASSNLASMDSDFQFASAVASFGMILRDSKYSGKGNLDWVVRIAEDNLGQDRFGYRKEFVSLVKQAKRLVR